MKNKWIKQALVTHFAGCSIGKTKLHPFLESKVRECLGGELKCPILNVRDTFSDGVYYNKLTKETYVKFYGVWYNYKSKMFTHYQTELEVAELDIKVRDAIVAISKTKYATDRQKELANKIGWLKHARRTKLEFFGSGKRLRQKIKEIKARKGLSNEQKPNE